MNTVGTLPGWARVRVRKCVSVSRNLLFHYIFIVTLLKSFTCLIIACKMQVHNLDVGCQEVVCKAILSLGLVEPKRTSAWLHCVRRSRTIDEMGLFFRV